MALVAGLAACARGGYDVVVRESPHGLWHELGGSASAGGVSQGGAAAACHAIRVDPAGQPYVAWTDDSTGQQEVYLRYWDGAVWASLGASAAPGGVSQAGGTVAQGNYHTCTGDLAVSVTQRPLLVWMSYQVGGEQPTYLKQWNGSAWVELGGSATAGGISQGGVTWWPTLTVDGMDRPVVAWTSDGEAYLRRLEGGGWPGVGGSESGLSAGVGGAELAVVARGAADQLYVAWRDEPTGVFEIYLSHWNGSAWGGLGGSASGSGLSATGVASNWPMVATPPQGAPVVAWADETGGGSTVQVRFWDGSRWLSFGDAPTLEAAGLAHGDAYHPSLALDESGAPVLAWEEDDALGRNIHTGRWTGSSWMSLDPAQPGGVSQSESRAEWPGIAVGVDGTLYVVWEQELTASIREIYLKALW